MAVWAIDFWPWGWTLAQKEWRIYRLLYRCLLIEEAEVCSSWPWTCHFWGWIAQPNWTEVWTLKCARFLYWATICIVQCPSIVKYICLCRISGDNVRYGDPYYRKLSLEALLDSSEWWTMAKQPPLNETQRANDIELMLDILSQMHMTQACYHHTECRCWMSMALEAYRSFAWIHVASHCLVNKQDDRLSQSLPLTWYVAVPYYTSINFCSCSLASKWDCIWPLPSW